MAELVDHVAKGTLPPPPGGPQRAGKQQNEHAPRIGWQLD